MSIRPVLLPIEGSVPRCDDAAKEVRFEVRDRMFAEHANAKRQKDMKDGRK